jgi:uncharacterized protein YbjT (DUF2867 family)
MHTPKKIFVTGATGNQGGATARHLLKNGFHVKALTRNASSAKAKQLKELNAEIVEGNLDHPSSYAEHLEGVDAVFCVSIFIKGVDKEMRQGISMANAAKENGIKHFLFSSVVGADANTGIPHWESKCKIENHVKKIGLPYTIIRPSSLYDNFLIPQVKSRLLKGKLVTPLKKDTIQQFISAEDIGRISTVIFMDPGKYMHKTLSIAAEEMGQTQVADSFSKVWGRQIEFQQLPGFITRLAMGRDLYKMFKWVNSNDARFIKDLDACKREFPGMISLEEWIKVYFK